MRFVARARHELARRPWIHWCLVAGLSTAAATSVASALAGVDRARESWGATANVLVATHPVPPGTPLAGVVERRSVPVAVVPDGAVAMVDLVDRAGGGAVARQHLAAGEIVTAADVAPASGPAALAPFGTRVVTVVVQVPTPAAVGDRVAIAADGVELVADAVVVGRLDGAILVAVRTDRAATVAAAAMAPTGVALLLVP
jgi:hypothetical protein